MPAFMDITMRNPVVLAAVAYLAMRTIARYGWKEVKKRFFC